jgi:hypothetical protein
MRFIPFSVGDTDAVHVYSDAHRIWLQLRRDVPTDSDIGNASFKVALSLTPDQAIAIAGELLTAATRNRPDLKPKSAGQNSTNAGGGHTRGPNSKTHSGSGTA